MVREYVQGLIIGNIKPMMRSSLLLYNCKFIYVQFSHVRVIEGIRKSKESLTYNDDTCVFGIFVFLWILGFYQTLLRGGAFHIIKLLLILELSQVMRINGVLVVANVRYMLILI